ncbi:MAG: RluA family pseudouridine synthase [Desulfuromonas sp.]|nr:MAG: RluA family pseudouridine synthase [Desulfuromonas sp.]
MLTGHFDLSSTPRKDFLQATIPVAKRWTIHQLTVSEQSEGLRLDQFLAAEIPDLSRGRAKKIIDLGGVHRSGRRTRSCSSAIRRGESIDVYLDHLSLDPFRFQTSDILYQDKYLIVLNKPAGIDTQPTHARYKGTIYEALQVYLQDPQRPQQKPELGMVQRLDRGTSGLMVFSTHPRSHRGLSRLFMEHRVEKRYLALVDGRPPHDTGEIRSLLARSRQQNRVRSVQRGGKEAITRYRVTQHFVGASLVSIELLTGRSHQIRAHMSELGCPLLGDSRYDGPTTAGGIDLARPLLHAAELSFVHPVTADGLTFSLPMPDDMAGLIRIL